MFVWGSTVFLDSRLSCTRTFAVFVDHRRGWVADGICAALGGDGLPATLHTTA